SAEIYFKEIPIGSTWCAVLLPIGPRLVGRASSMAAYEIRICGVCGLVDWFVPERLLSQGKEKFLSIPEVLFFASAHEHGGANAARDRNLPAARRYPLMVSGP